MQLTSGKLYYIYSLIFNSIFLENIYKKSKQPLKLSEFNEWLRLAGISQKYDISPSKV